jgi:hypothetical protein
VVYLKTCVESRQVLSQTIMDTVARFHKVRYNERILCSRVAPALDSETYAVHIT